METQPLSDNITKLLERVGLAAEKYDRKTQDILLLAVSKTRPASDIQKAYDCGLTAFGESYLQEAIDKIEQLQNLPLNWHFIGPIQSNKTRAIAGHFDWVHSVDRLKIAQRLNDQRPATLPPLQVCLQVNVSGESSKSGVDPRALAQLAQEVRQLPNLCLRGLMAIPQASDEFEHQRRAFAELRHLFDELRADNPDLDTLSMGMSGDLEAAIAEGATIIRVGTALFGPRNR
tara:strand:+ start:88807 stop:89499 length:693 start_codon:yes stop_codon:yes gene_type:complete